MKKIKYTLFLTILLFSCKSPDLIKSYLEYENIENNKVVVLKNKTSLKEALRIFDLGITKLDNKKYFKVEHLYDSMRSKFLYNKYNKIKDYEFWEEDKFKNLCDTLINKKDLNTYYKKKKLNYSNNKHPYLYSFSDIIEYSDSIKFFNANKSLLMDHIYSKVIVYQKIKGKWVKTEEIINTDLY